MRLGEIRRMLFDTRVYFGFLALVVLPDGQFPWRKRKRLLGEASYILTAYGTGSFWG